MIVALARCLNWIALLPFCTLRFTAPSSGTVLNRCVNLDIELSTCFHHAKSTMSKLGLVLRFVLKFPVLPVVKVIFQRAAHGTFTWWLSRLCIRTNHMSCLVSDVIKVMHITCAWPDRHRFWFVCYCWIIKWMDHFRRLPNCPQSLSFNVHFSDNFSVSGLYNSI